jgi:flagellar protein FliL
MAEEKKDPAKEKEAAASADGAKEGEGEAAAGSSSNKKKLIIIGAAALLVLILGAAGGFFLLKKGGPDAASEQKTPVDKHALDSRRGRKSTPGTEAGTDEGKEIDKEKGAKEGGAAGGPGAANKAEIPANYEDLQEFLVNLNTGGKQTSFLKLVVTLDISDAAARQAVDANMPRIRDSFQVYLRELRAEDLRGSAGLQLLREELLLRVNKIIAPAKIDDILFKEIIVQ